MELILDTKDQEVHVVSPEATVLEAVESMCEAHIGALLVMREATLVGIFSERDLMRRVVLAGRDPARTRVVEVMTEDVVCVPPDLSPHEAMALITRRCVRHLPVVVGRRIVGVISIGDLVRWMIRERDYEIDQLRDYVAGRYPG